MLKALLISCLFLISSLAYAQHTQNEIALSAAYSGQVALIGERTNDFYSAPFIGQLRAQLLTDGVQSLSLTLEHVREWRERREEWTEDPRDAKRLSDLNELLHLTSLGFEVYRNLLTSDKLRIGAGLGISYGFGGASLDVSDVSSGAMREFSSCQTWQAVGLEALARLRYTVSKSERSDVGVTLTARYWGFPYLSPIGECPNFYNGPDFRSLHELGYLLGVSYGF